MQPTSMATIPEACENVFKEVTSQGMESPSSPGRPAAPFPCPVISYSRYRLSPTATGCHCTCKLSACQLVSSSLSARSGRLGLRLSARRLRRLVSQSARRLQRLSAFNRVRTT